MKLTHSLLVSYSDRCFTKLTPDDVVLGSQFSESVAMSAGRRVASEKVVAIRSHKHHHIKIPTGY